MSDNLLFNWGNRSPEDSQRQRRIEEEAALMEQAASQFGQTGQTGGVGGGSNAKALAIINNGVQTVDSFFILVPEVGKTNYTYFVTDYSNNKINGPIDTGVSSEDYNYTNRYSIYKKGYFVLFTGTVDSNNYTMLFIDAAGTIISTISGYTGDLQTHFSPGWVVATDYDEEILWYFDGETFTTNSTYLQTADNGFSIGSDGNLENKVGFGLTTSKTNGDITYSIVNNSGVNEIFTWNSIEDEDSTFSFILYLESQVAVFREYDEKGDRHRSLRFFNTVTGAQIGSTFSLLSGNYTTVQHYPYGVGNHMLIYESASEYKIINYSAISNSLDELTINKTGYSSIGVSTETFNKYSSNHFAIHNTLCIQFYTSVGGASGLNEVSSCKIVYVVNGSNLLTEDLKLPGVGPNIKFGHIRLNKNYVSLLADIGDDQYTIITLTQSGDNQLATGFPTAEYSSLGSERSNEKAIYYINNTLLSSPTPAAANFFLVNSTGTAYTESEIDETIDQVNISSGTVIINTANREFRLNSSTNLLVEISKYDESYFPRNYTNDLLQDPSIILQLKNNWVPYTHTQMVGIDGEADPGDFAMDGAIVPGSNTNFGVGSSYFTNLYPGLFVLCAKNINISSFSITGNIGADGSGDYDNYDFTVNSGGIDYTVFVKRVWNTGDPSINQIIIVDSDNTSIFQSVDATNERDTHELFNIPNSVNEIHYLLLSRGDEEQIESSDIAQIVNSYLTLVGGLNISATLAVLNSTISFSPPVAAYETITDHVPSLYLFNDTPDTLSNEIDDGGDDMYDGANRITTNLSGAFSRFIKPNAIVQFSGFPVDIMETEIGENMMAVLYFDSENSSKLSLKVFNFSGQLKHYIKTDHYEYSLLRIIGNRLLLIVHTKTFNGIDLYASTTVYSGTLSSYKLKSYNSLELNGNITNMPNDTAWWD